MKIYFTKIGVEKSRDTSEDNFVYGDNLTGSIEAYFDELDPKNYLNRIVVERPDGTRTNELPMILTQNQLGVYYQLNDSLINQAGTYHITIRLKEASDGDYIIKAASQFDIIVDSGVVANDDTNITSAEYATLVDKLNKVDVKAAVAKQYTSLEEVGYDDSKWKGPSTFANCCSKLPRGCRIYLNLFKDVSQEKYPNFYEFITSQNLVSLDADFTQDFNIEIVNTYGLYKDDNKGYGDIKYYVRCLDDEDELSTQCFYEWSNSEWFRTNKKVFNNLEELGYKEPSDDINLNSIAYFKGTLLLLKHYLESVKETYPKLYAELSKANGYSSDTTGLFICNQTYDEDVECSNWLYSNGKNLVVYKGSGWFEIKETDEEVNASSENPISNKAITTYINSLINDLESGATHVGYAEKAYKDSFGNIINVSTIMSSISAIIGNSSDSSDKLTLYGLKNKINENQMLTNRQIDAVNIDLQGQIDALNAGQNLADIVGTFADLENYNTEYLHANDKVEVMQDETHGNASTVYNWNGTSFEFVGTFGGGGGGGGNSYTKAESDERYAKKDETYTKTEADSEFVKANDSSFTGTTNAENIIVSGDTKVHHLEVEESITVPNPSDKSEPTTKEYVDNGNKYDMGIAITAVKDDKLTDVKMAITSTYAEKCGNFYIKGNNNTILYNGTIRFKHISGTSTGTITFSWSNGTEDFAEVTPAVGMNEYIVLKDTLTNLELLNNGYLGDYYAAYANYRLITTEAVLSMSRVNRPIIINVSTSTNQFDEATSKLIFNNYKNIKINDFIYSGGAFGNGGGSVNYSQTYIGGYENVTIEGVTLSAGRDKTKIDMDHYINNPKSITLYKQFTYNLKNTQGTISLTRLTDSAKRNQTTFIYENVIIPISYCENLIAVGQTIYNGQTYLLNLSRTSTSTSVYSYTITITDVPDTSTPVIELTGNNGTLTAEQSALLDKDNVMIKWTDNSVGENYHDYNYFTKTRNTNSNDTNYDDQWTFTQTDIDYDDTTSNYIRDIVVNKSGDTYTWVYTLVDLNERFVNPLNTEINELKTSKQDAIKYINVTESTTSIPDEDLATLQASALNYIKYTMSINGVELIVDLYHTKTRGTMHEYVGYYLSGEIPQPIDLTLYQTGAISVHKGRYQEEIQVVTLDDVPKEATQGTLTVEQMQILESTPYNEISFNNERYIQMDTQHESGHLVYTHVGQDTAGSFYTKSIDVTMSTRGWVLTVIKQASTDYVDNLIISSINGSY